MSHLTCYHWSFVLVTILLLSIKDSMDVEYHSYQQFNILICFLNWIGHFRTTSNNYITICHFNICSFVLINFFLTALIMSTWNMHNYFPLTSCKFCQDTTINLYEYIYIIKILRDLCRYSMSHFWHNGAVNQDGYMIYSYK